MPGPLGGRGGGVDIEGRWPIVVPERSGQRGGRRVRGTGDVRDGDREVLVGLDVRVAVDGDREAGPGGTRGDGDRAARPHVVGGSRGRAVDGGPAERDRRGRGVVEVRGERERRRAGVALVGRGGVDGKGWPVVVPDRSGQRGGRRVRGTGDVRDGDREVLVGVDVRVAVDGDREAGSPGARGDGDRAARGDVVGARRSRAVDGGPAERDRVLEGRGRGTAKYEAARAGVPFGGRRAAAVDRELARPVVVPDPSARRGGRRVRGTVTFAMATVRYSSGSMACRR